MKNIILSTLGFVIIVICILQTSCKKNQTNIVGSNNCNDNFILLYDSICCLFVPNIFSPNGDGKNDIYTVVTTSGLSTLSITIKDSNQNTLYTGSGLNAGWDGTVNTQVQPETYYQARIQATFTGCPMIVDTTTCFYLGKYNSSGCIPKYSTSVPLKFGDQVDPVSCNGNFVSGDTLCP